MNIESLSRKARVLVACYLLFALFGTPFCSAQTEPAKPRSDDEIRQSVDALLHKMTLEEKIGQLSQLFAFGPPEQFEERIAKAQIGSLLFVTDPALRNRYQRIAIEKTRLKIPLIFGLDVIHGYRTGFPVPIGMAASWDPALVTQVQSAAAKEARASGIDWTFAPMLDIARDPRLGRIIEGAGEDPYLGSAMAAAQVKGFQGDYVGAPDHLLACMKHFAGYGAAEGGRDYEASNIPDSQMYNIYLPPFRAAVRAGVGSAMSAYMDLNDVPATGNRWLLHDVLRDQLKFDGFVVSDANSVKSLETHGYARDLSDAATLAFNAGVDMEMAIGKTAYSEHLLDDVKTGRVSEKQINEAARRILEAKMRMGLFDHPYTDETKVEQALSIPEHRTLARIAAERTTVLLRNDGNLLPLSKSAYKNIAVIGPTADSPKDTSGPWIFNEDPSETVTYLAGLRALLGPQVNVRTTPGVQLARKFPSFFDEILHVPPPVPWTPDQADAEMAKAVDLANSSDLTILVIGELQNMIGEAASRQSLDLPGRQQELLEKVVGTGKPVVLVLTSGRPLNITWAAQHVPAILEVWYPGTKGGTALANLLFGDANPGGRLPFTWPRNAGQVPMFYAHNRTQDPENQGKRYWEEESTPLYPFGYGLSYSRYAYSNLKIARNQIKPGETIDVTVDVENLSDRVGDAVPQLYIHQQSGSASRPVRELKGFERSALAAHEKKTIHFSLGKSDLSYWSSSKRDWVNEPAVFDVLVGADSDASLHGNFTVAK